LKQASDILSKRRQLLAASALVPVIGALSRPATLQALIYTFFVCVYLAPFVIKATKKKDIADIDPEAPAPDGSTLADSAVAQIKQLKKSRRAANVNFILALIGAGLVSQCLAWISAYLAASAPAREIHQQFFETLLLSLFFYLTLALVWLWILKRWQFELKEIFFVCFLGALFEQAIAGTLTTLCGALVTDPVAALLTLASLLVVGGSITSLGFLAGGKIGPHEKRLPMPRLLTKYCLSLILIGALLGLTSYVGSLLAMPLGMPAQGPVEIPRLL
jgi:hypothetical protein